MTDVAMKPTVELLTIQQVADLCGTSLRTFHRWLKAGSVPSPVRLGPGTRGAIRFRKSDIESWIEAGCPRNVARGKVEQKEPVSDYT